MSSHLTPARPEEPERHQGSDPSAALAAPSAELADAPPWGKKSPLKVIRARCLDCTGGSAHEVKLCPATACPAWYHRFGKPPATVARRTPDLLDKAAVLALGKQVP